MASFMVTLKEPQPIDFETNAVENIRYFRQEFLQFCSLSGLNHVSERVRVQYLYTAVGSPARHILRNVVPTMPEYEQGRVDAILWRLAEYCSQNSERILLERLHFNRMSQYFGESLDEYAERIRYRAAKCRFECDVDGRMRERFMAGLHHEGQINFILMEGGDNVTFREAVHLAKSWRSDKAVQTSPPKPSVCAEFQIPTSSATSHEFVPNPSPIMIEEKVDLNNQPTPRISPVTSAASHEYAPNPRPMTEEELMDLNNYTTPRSRITADCRRRLFKYMSDDTDDE